MNSETCSIVSNVNLKLLLFLILEENKNFKNYLRFPDIYIALHIQSSGSSKKNGPIEVQIAFAHFEIISLMIPLVKVIWRNATRVT